MTIYISIGNTCFMAKYLRSSGKRSEAFPFDWLISSLKYVSYICKTRNYDEIIKVMFNISEVNIKTKNKKNLIVKHRCPELAKIEFYHDFYSFGTVLGQLEKVKEKYLRRIKRLHNYLDNTEEKKVLVLWTQRFNIDEIYSLIDIIKDKNCEIVAAVSKNRIIKPRKIKYPIIKKTNNSVVYQNIHQDTKINIIVYHYLNLLTNDLNLFFKDFV